MVAVRPSASQRGISLIELLLATAIGAILLAGLNSVVKLGLDAQTAGRASNEIAYQGNFALQRMADKALALAPKVLATPAAGTTGNWFAPTGCAAAACVMYCRKASNQLIETTTADTACSGSTIIAHNVTAFSAQLLSGANAADDPTANLSLTLTSGNSSVSLSSSVRLGGGTL